MVQQRVLLVVLLLRRRTTSSATSSTIELSAVRLLVVGVRALCRRAVAPRREWCDRVERQSIQGLPLRAGHNSTRSVVFVTGSC